MNDERKQTEGEEQSQRDEVSRTSSAKSKVRKKKPTRITVFCILLFNIPYKMILHFQKYKLLYLLSSKKPLKRIVIEEIGTESDSDHEDGTTDVSTRAQVTASLSTDETRNNSNQSVSTDAFDQANSLKVESKDNSCTMSPVSSSSSSLSSHIQSPASTAQSKSTLKSLAVPKSSGQFQADWRALQREPEQLFHYFRVGFKCGYTFKKKAYSGTLSGLKSP